MKRGTLEPIRKRHHASIIDPKAISDLLQAIQSYEGYFVKKCALRMAPLVFVRPEELRKAEWRIPAAKMKMREIAVARSDQRGLLIGTLQKELNTLVEAQSAFTKQTLQQMDTLRQNYKVQLTAFINNPTNQITILNSSIPLSPSVVPAGTDVSQLSQATIIQAKVATLNQVTQNVPTRTGSLNKAYELREDELNQLPAEERYKTSEAFKETSVTFWTAQDHMMYLVFYMHETNRSLSQTRNDLKLLQAFFDHRQNMIVELMQEIDKISDQRKTNIHALMAKLQLQPIHDQAEILNKTISSLNILLQMNTLKQFSQSIASQSLS